MQDMVNVVVHHLMNVLVVMSKLVMNLAHGQTGQNVPSSVVVVISLGWFVYGLSGFFR